MLRRSLVLPTRFLKSHPSIGFRSNSASVSLGPRRMYSSFQLQARSLPANTIIKFVPQQEAWVVERFGRFHRVLEPGLRFLIPVVDQIKYVNSLKEVAIEIPSQSAITQDNVTLDIDGVLYVRIVDPFKASYGVHDAGFAVSQLAQTTMRAEIGQLSLDRTLAERQSLNHNIVEAINAAANEWGIRCLRYEIRDIHPPELVIEAMHSQVSADRRKRADILASEGQRQAAINVAEGEKQGMILRAEAQKMEVLNRAQGEAEAVKLQAQAKAQAVNNIAEALAQRGALSHEALRVLVAEQYIGALGNIAKKGTTVLLGNQGSGQKGGLGGVGDVGSMVASALSVYDAVATSPVVGNKMEKNSGEQNGSRSIDSGNSSPGMSFPL